MVSIITINYNGWQDTCELIKSIKRYESYPHEIIVVDNASKDNDVIHIRSSYPEVIVIESSQNLGFAGGNNLGYAHARGEYLFFLNNDMVIKSSILEPMIDCLLENKIGGVSPCIVSLYHPQILQYYGYQELSSITLRHTTLTYDPLKREMFLIPKVTQVLHGGAMMVRRDVIECVGRMTEDYFLFFEEFDWSKRIREAGYKLYYEPRAIVYHKESMTIKPQTPLREYYLARSRMIFARRNCHGIYKYLSCCYQLLFAMPKKILLYLKKKRFDLIKAIWQGTWSGLFFVSSENENSF